jgi:hypothetical protein
MSRFCRGNLRANTVTRHLRLVPDRNVVGAGKRFASCGILFSILITAAAAQAQPLEV